MTSDVLDYYRDAEDYDLVHGTSADLSFWAEACQRYRPASVLELAVGTGRVAIPLARQGVSQGFSVTGVDITPQMLVRAREMLRQEPAAVQANLTLLGGDIRSLALGRCFDLVIIAYNSILHFVTPEDRQSAFRCAREHVAPGGRFIVDVFNPSAAALAQAQEPITGLELAHQVDDETAGQRLIGNMTRRYDATTQTLRTRLFTERYRRGRRREKGTRDAVYHIYFPEELRLLLEHAGFKVEALFGDYQWGPFVPNCPRMIFVALAPSKK